MLSLVLSYVVLGKVPGIEGTGLRLLGAPVKGRGAMHDTAIGSLAPAETLRGLSRLGRAG